jgi:hypothetical protein
MHESGEVKTFKGRLPIQIIVKKLHIEITIQK